MVKADLGVSSWSERPGDPGEVLGLIGPQFLICK